MRKSLADADHDLELKSEEEKLMASDKSAFMRLPSRHIRYNEA